MGVFHNFENNLGKTPSGTCALRKPDFIEDTVYIFFMIGCYMVLATGTLMYV